MSKSNREHLHLPASRKWTILAVLLFTLCAVAVLYGFDHQAMKALHRDARLLNVAGRQRMLSQKLSKAAARIQVERDANEIGNLRRETGDALELWKTFHEALRRRDPRWNLQGANSPEILAMFDGIEPHYRAMLEAGEGLARGKFDAHSNGVTRTGFQECQQILGHEAAYLKGMDQIVTAYQQETQVRVRSSQRSEAAMTLLAFAALVALGFTCFRRTAWLERSNLALHMSQERFALVVRSCSDGVWDWNILTNEVYISARFKALLGYQDDELENKFASFESSLHPEDRERVMAALRDHLERRGPYDVEYRLRTKSGQYRWFVAHGQAVWDDTGIATRMAGSITDITERKRADRQLRQREAALIAAQRIQERLLPQNAPALPGFDIAGAVYPAEFAGGDYFDYLNLRDGALGVVVGDVSGHCVSSALLAATTSAHIRSFAEVYSGIDDILAHANSLLARETEGHPFVTLFFARIDAQRRSLSYINAGHPSGYVFDESGVVKAVLKSESVPLAVLPDTKFPIGGPVNLQSGDTALLITDGILEARSPDGQMFGSERLLQVVRDHRTGRACEIVEGIHRAIRDFTQEHTEDDVTVVAIRLTPT